MQGYDYSQPGAYFITICTQNRECLFGDIADGEMILNPFGEIVASRWHIMPEQFPHVGVDAFVVMPNHIHGIVIIGVVGAPLAGALPIPGAMNTTDERRHLPPDDRATLAVAPTVGDIAGAYKSICVLDCLAWINNHERQRRLGKLWQRNYWEHVIRDETELNRIREYIYDNPKNWEQDENFL